MPHDIEAIAEQVFTALADPTRRAILAALASGGPATATDLAALLPITRATSPMAGASLKPCPENPPSIDKFGAAGSGPTRPCPSEV